MNTESTKLAEQISTMIIEGSPDAIICADEEGMVIFWNKAAETMFGYTKREALRKVHEDLLAEIKRLKAKMEKLER